MIEMATEDYVDFERSLTEAFDGDGLGLWWLGQAGFALKHENHVVVIDPYLSDFLARKYLGREYPHVRMMPPPIPPDRFPEADWVLCTHRHSDHMDPETLVPLSAHPRCLFVVPKAERDWAVGLGLPEDRVIGLDDGEQCPLPGIGTVAAIPSAHEDLQTNDRGEHHYLGYILDIGGIRLYHSGDCVPYPGLVNRLRGLRVDLALLPVNGRDEIRRSRNVPGNFTLSEAMATCDQADIPMLIGHHFGMFDFNTIDPEEARKDLTTIPRRCTVLLAEAGKKYIVKRTG